MPYLKFNFWRISFMSLLKFIHITIAASGLVFFSLSAQGNFGSSNIPTLPPLNQNPGMNQRPAQTPNRPAPVDPKNDPALRHSKTDVVPVPLVSAQASYLHPGILIFKNGNWEGSDHLLNLPNNIGVYVNINKPDDLLSNISTAKIKEVVTKLFTDVAIVPNSVVLANQPPLPAFELQILVYPVGKGFAAGLEGRLFEAVTLPRLNTLGADLSFQAITWERKSLIVGPVDTINEQLVKSASEITAAFIERVKGVRPLQPQPQ